MLKKKKKKKKSKGKGDNMLASLSLSLSLPKQVLKTDGQCTCTLCTLGVCVGILCKVKYDIPKGM